MKIFPETVFQTLLGLMTGLESEYFPMIIIVLLRFTGLIVGRQQSSHTSIYNQKLGSIQEICIYQ